MLGLLLAIGVIGGGELRAQADGTRSTRSDSIAPESFPIQTDRQCLWGFGVGRLGLSTMNAYQKPATDPPMMAAFVGNPEYSPGFFTLSLVAEKNHRSLSTLTFAYRDQTLHFEHEYGEFSSGSSKDCLARLSWAYCLISPDVFDKPSFLLSAGPSVYYLHRDYLKQYSDTLFGFRSAQEVQAQILFLQVGPHFSIRKNNLLVSAAAHFNLFGWISGSSSYDVIEHPGPIVPYRVEAQFSEAVGPGFISGNTLLLNDLELSMTLLFR